MTRMTVRRLINQLKKMPPTAYVAWRDHDQSEDEINGFVRCVDEGSENLVLKRNESGDDIRHIVVISS